jgi:YVTN family beta-propeller protein
VSWIGVALFALLFAACGSAKAPATPGTRTTSTPSAGTVSATISGIGAQTGEAGYSIAGSDSAVWVYNGEAGTIARVDPGTNKVVATIPVGHGLGSVALGQGAVWVVNTTEGTLSRIDPQTNKVVANVTFGSPNEPGCCVEEVTVSPGAVWVSDFTDRTLVRIDPQTNKVVTTIPDDLGPTGVSFGAGSVWVCNHHSDSQGLMRLDPQTNQVQAQMNPAGNAGFCGSVVALGQTIWTTSFFNDSPSSTLLERIDPTTNTVSATITVPPAVLPFYIGVAADAQGVWLLDPAVGIYRIDPQTNHVAGELAMPGGAGVALGDGSVWLAKADGTLLRITPAR